MAVNTEKSYRNTNKSFRFITSLIAIFVLVCCFSCSGMAAPDYIGGGDTNYSAVPITITNPDKVYSSTYNKTYSLSGFTNADSKVYVYISDGNGGYKRYYMDGVAVSADVGASGLFVVPVKLNAGKNPFLLRVENNGNVGYAKFEINLLSSSMYNLIKGYKVKTF